MMIYFIMARHNDARPVIDYYGLKKDMGSCPFTTFTSGNVVLCLSDEGKANAAAATAYVLSRWGRDGLFVHLGYLDAQKAQFFGGLEGDWLYPHAILSREEMVYQEMLYKPPSFVKEGILEDDEGVYAFLAASRFLPLKQIMVLRTSNPINKGIFEGMLSWLETICTALYPFGMIRFPISMWRKGHGIIP